MLVSLTLLALLASRSAGQMSCRLYSLWGLACSDSVRPLVSLASARASVQQPDQAPGPSSWVVRYLRSQLSRTSGVPSGGRSRKELKMQDEGTNLGQFGAALKAKTNNPFGNVRGSVTVTPAPTVTFTDWRDKLKKMMTPVLGAPAANLIYGPDKGERDDIATPLLPPGPPLVTSTPEYQNRELLQNVLGTSTAPFGWAAGYATLATEPEPPPPPNEEFTLQGPTLKELPPQGASSEDLEDAFKIGSPGFDRLTPEQQKAMILGSAGRNADETQAYIDQLNYAIQGGHLADQLYEGYFYNPTTGERQQLPADVIEAIRAAGIMPSVVQRDYQSQYREWLDTLNAYMGITRETPMNEYMSVLQKEWEDYNQPLPEEQSWYSEPSYFDGWGGGGGGGGGYDYEPQFWLNRVKWNI